MPHVQLSDVKVFFEDSGGDGPPVVFSHGLMMDHEMFEPQVEALSGEFRCITWDERGHGDTPAPGPFSYWDSAKDLFGILDHLGIPEAILVGMSQGGFLSMRAALLEPERVAALAFIDSQAGPEDPERLPSYEVMLEMWKAGQKEVPANATAEIILGPGTDQKTWIDKWIERPTEWVVEPFNTLAAREDLHDRLGEIVCPALVIHGTADAAISMELAQRLCEGLSGCEGVVQIEGGSHASNLSHPDEVNDALHDFLARQASRLSAKN